MNEETYKTLKQWIFDNHNHHDMHVCDNSFEDEDYICSDGEKPFVDSLELEKFIDKLYNKQE